MLKNSIKKATALSVIGLVSLSLVGGTSTFAYDDDYYEDRYEYVEDRYDYLEDRYDYLEDQYEAQARQAYLQNVNNLQKSTNNSVQVNTNQVKLKTREEIKTIVAKSLGKNQDSIWFEKIELSDDYYESNIFEVEARVAYQEHHLKIDGKTGKVLSSRVDN